MGRWYDWLEQRLGISAVRGPLEAKTVPLHRNTIWYYFGGMTLFFFIIQVVTGILLMLYYRPSAEERLRVGRVHHDPRWSSAGSSGRSTPGRPT